LSGAQVKACALFFCFQAKAVDCLPEIERTEMTHENMRWGAMQT